MTVKELRDALKGVAGNAGVSINHGGAWVQDLQLYIHRDGDVVMSPSAEEDVAKVLHRD